jgi:hypothetical protein
MAFFGVVCWDGMGWGEVGMPYCCIYCLGREDWEMSGWMDEHT